MTYLENYLQLIKDRGNVGLADSIQQTVNKIAPKYFENFSFCDHEVGCYLVTCSLEKLVRCLELCVALLIWDFQYLLF